MVRLERQGGVATVLKPFKAIDRALFKTYEDFSGLKLLVLWISVLLSLGGVYGGYRLGLRYGGEPGGLLIGGLVAVLPIFVEYSGIAKSCNDAWMLGIAAVSCAAVLAGARRQWWTGLLFGLAIACRIDSLMLAPLILWMLWDNGNSEAFWPSAIKICVTAFVTLGLAAPWLMQAFIGTLRTIGMARVTGYWLSESPRLKTLKELMWREGMGPLLLATLAGLIFASSANRRKLAALTVLAGGLAASMFGSQYEPMRYHGVPLITLLAFAAVCVGSLFKRIISRPFSVALVSLLLVLPFVQAVHTVREWKSYYFPDSANEWIEEHIPAGTIVYMHINFASRAILPTEAAADDLWRLVAGDQAWRVKLEDGLRRFSLPKEELPRAMSQDNLAMDQGICRRWFILGGGKSPRPRYDVRLLGLYPNVDFPDFKKTGGVLLWRTVAGRKPPEGLAEPTMKWVNEKGYGTMVYVSPDLLKNLKAEFSASQ
jgi:hypothetical protein